VQGALDGTSTFEDSLTGSEEVSGTLQDLVIGELPFSVPVLDFRYTFTTSSGSNVLQIDATGTFTGLDDGPGLLLDGDVFFHATLTTAGTDASGGSTIFRGHPGNNAFTGTSGVDTVDYSGSPSGVTADLQGGTAVNGYGGTDSLSSIENLNGSAFDDVLSGTEGNNVFVGGGGNDVVIGRLGLDTMQFANARSADTITRAGDTIIVAGPEGVDTLTGIERLQFSDRTVAFDLSPGEAAGNTVRIVGAAFDAPRLTPDIVGAGIGLFDTGASMLQLAQLALSTSLWGGPRSNVDFVNTVYRNVVGVLPSPQERDFYVGLLQGSGGTMTQAELLVLAANSPQNEVNINLVGMQQSGVDFV
jgi:Ca2+-binding RTX toxin-like protein